MASVNMPKGEIVTEGRRLMSLGYQVYALRENTKIHQFKEPRPLDRVSLHSWVRTYRVNIGIVLGNGLMVVDTDGPEGEEWCKEHGLVSSMMVQTRRGIHRLLQHNIEEPKNRIGFAPQVDLIFNGHTVGPQSTVDGHTYTWLAGPVPREELPMFPADLLTEKPKPDRCETSNSLVVADTSRIVEVTRNYVAKIVAVSGQGGDRRTFRVACVLAERLQDKALAWAELLRWNETCAEPPWDEKALRHKLECAFARVQMT